MPIIHPKGAAAILVEPCPVAPSIASNIPTLDTDTGGMTNWSLRQIVSINRSGEQVRIRVKAHSVSGSQIDNVGIGIRATGGNGWATTETPQELLFGGTSGFTLGAGAEMMSDLLTLNNRIFSYDQFVIIFDISNANGSLLRNLVTSGPLYTHTNTNSYNQQDPSGFTIDSNTVFVVTEVELRCIGA